MIPRPATHDWDIGRGVRGYRWTPERPRAALLLQHGYAEHARRYLDHHARLIPHLVAMGIAVHAIDLEGHGGSPGRRGGADVDRAVEDHRAARRAMREEAAGLPVFLFGHSLGGLVTAASMVREPGGVAGVVLSSPALLTASTAPMRGLARLLTALTPTLGTLTPQDPVGLSRISDEVEAFRRDPLVHRGRMPARLAGSALALQRELWTRTAHWRAPLLVVHGDDDSYADHRGSALFAGLVGGDDRVLHAISGGRHELLNDRGRGAMRATLLGWIDARIV